MKQKEKIIIATNNQEKLKEMKQILKGYELLSLKDINYEIEIEEDQETIEGNSKKKAREIERLIQKPCIADDTGLCIEAFNGWPGVYTDRFLGEDATPEQRNEAILEKMKHLKGEERKARVVCIITYCEKERMIVAKGEIEGKIAEEPRGENGFGFDTIFELANGRTYAELSKEEKNEISHRKRAIENLEKQLTKQEEYGKI